MLHLTTAKVEQDAPEEERVPLFSIDDTVYTIPKELDASTILVLLDDLATAGEAVAIVRLLKRFIGEDGYTALKSFKGLKPADLAQLMSDLTTWAFGQVEEFNKITAPATGN